MICPTCKKEGEKSNVFYENSTSTLLGYSPHWDYKGNYHNHDPNTTTSHYRCSNGHTWDEEHEKSCPNCDWTG